MTVLDEVRATPAPTDRRRRPRRRRTVLAVAVAAVVALGIGSWTYAGSYQPWQNSRAGFWTGHGIVGLTDGTRETSLAVTAPPGQAGSFPMVLHLGGWQSVRILGSRSSDALAGVSVEWKVLSDYRLITALPVGATSRPVVVHPGQLVEIWVIASRTTCPPGGASAVRWLPLRWQALGVRHTYQVMIARDSEPLPLYLCYPPDALRHVYK